MIISTPVESKQRPHSHLPEEPIHLQVKQPETLRQLDQMFSAVPNSVVLLNQDRKIVYANSAFQKIAYTPDKQTVLGAKVGEAVGCIHAFETKGGCGTTEFCSQCGAAKAIARAQKGSADVQECRILSQRDEDMIALDLRVWATPSEFGEEPYTVFSMVDISDEKRRRVLERIFFHDITNTASVIKGLVDIFVSMDDPAELREFQIDSMLSQVSSQLIDEIKAQAQLMAAESGDLTTEATPFYTNELLQRLIALYRNHSVAEGKTIELAAGAENVLVWSDAALIGRVLSNMLKNGLEASTAGETVTVGCERQGDSVCLWVHNPKVMPKHIQLQIFQRSFSTKGEGRGLGTYSMKLLTESYLQGRVSFESDAGKGTTFMVTYPLGEEKK